MMNDPLQLPLRDIHLPPGVSWWPPAPGWWLLALLVSVLLVALYWWYQRGRRLRRSAAYQALRELQALDENYRSQGDSLQLLREVSVLLRRLCISRDGRAAAAGLTGKEWLQYLDSSLEGHPFSEGPGKILVDGPYRASLGEAEIDPLLQLCEAWITSQSGTRGRKT